MRMLSIVGAVALLVSVPAFAGGDDGHELAQKSGCLACHSPDRKIVGPAYKDVAKKYAHDNGAFEKLFHKVKNGGSGIWGPIPMPPNPQVSDADLKKILHWVLSMK
jgi:cytochrome c